MNKLKLAVIGCTGSIGTQTLDIIREHPELFELIAVSAHSNWKKINLIYNEFRPHYIGIIDSQSKFRLECPTAEIFDGKWCNCNIVNQSGADCIVIANSGMEAIFPLLEAIRAKKRIAIANKESLVCAGELVKAELIKNDVELIPVDSEHSAIFQCLQGIKGKEEIEKIILTASGGAFRDFKYEELKNVTAEDALRHPNWRMGKKITIDCATMANKGLEVMEANVLFGIPPEKIEVLIHKQSTIHSMIQMVDGAVMAQLGVADMRTAIQYALTYPKREKSSVGKVDFTKEPLTFEKPDYARYPALKLAYDALMAKGNAPCVYNGANQRAVELFMEGKMGYLDIAVAIEYALNQVPNCPINSIEDVMEFDDKAHQIVDRFAKRVK